MFAIKSFVEHVLSFYIINASIVDPITKHNVFPVLSSLLPYCFSCLSSWELMSLWQQFVVDVNVRYKKRGTITNESWSRNKLSKLSFINF